MEFRFPRAARITRSPEYRRVRGQGRSRPGKYLVLGVLREPETDSGSGIQPTRFGIITSRKIGNSVVRKRVRRRFREIVRLHRPEFLPGWLVVIVGRPAAASANYADLEHELLHLARKASILSAS